MKYILFYTFIAFNSYSQTTEQEIKQLPSTQIIESPTSTQLHPFTAASNENNNSGNNGLTIEQLSALANKKDEVGTWNSPATFKTRNEILVSQTSQTNDSAIIAIFVASLIVIGSILIVFDKKIFQKKFEAINSSEYNGLKSKGD